VGRERDAVQRSVSCRGAAALLVALVTLLFPAIADAAIAGKSRRPGPIRVLLVGDSITASYQDEAAALLRARGYQVVLAGLHGRSLLDQNMCKGAAVSLLRAFHDPDVVVLEGISNYALLTAGGIPPCQPMVAKYSKAFYREWRKAAKANTKAADRKRTIWVLAPQTRSDVGIRRLNDIYRKLGRYPLARTVDAWTSFGGATYNASLHVADGIHLNQAGQNRLAALVAAAVG
jgi:lysophospholipase L1-like esterase